jgi:aryl-alcohol dehydrogenase-like predicted oxidoreductase
MELRSFGASGLKVSAVGLGTNNFGTRLDEGQVRQVIDASLDAGINFIDTADVYGKGASETLIGNVLGGRRQEFILATKFGLPMSDSPYERGGSRRWVMREVEASLRRLRTDYIDLYQYHRPDPETPILETLQALDDLVRQGKVRYVGHSNFSGWQIADADWTARAERLAIPISAQNRCSLIRREIEAEVLPACRRFGLGMIPYYPLASGFLTGKYRRATAPGGGRLTGSAMAAEILTEENFDRLDRFEEFAREHGRSMLELAIGWLLSHPEMTTVICSASSPEQVAANAAAGGWRLDAAEMAAVAAI